MISNWLVSVVRCPICVNGIEPDAGRLTREGDVLACAQCSARYSIRDGYLDLRPPRALSGKETVYTDADAN